MAKRTTVVISQGQSHNPAKRDLEETLVTLLLMEPGLEVIVVPHLYDLKPDGTGVLALQGIPGTMIVLSWLYDRGARWTLDRHGIRGQAGITLLKSTEEDEQDEDDDSSAAGGKGEDDANGESASEKKLRVIDDRPTPSRKIYCIDLRLHNSPEPFIAEVRRIAAENQTQVVDLMGWIGGASPPSRPLDRFLNPTNTTALGPPSPAGLSGSGSSGSGSASSSNSASLSGPASSSGPTASISSPVASSSSASPDSPQIVRLTEDTDRRWYPVIDYSRCTNCMECIDFCLFGVYGVDKVETILVEQPDNCRKGCPACSRVCPENAIIFPQHKTPAIAGAAVGAAGALKIDLSRLFGAPDGSADAFDIAARERDEQLMLAGRDTVGKTVGIPKRQPVAQGPKDDLDNLIDALDNLDL